MYVRHTICVCMCILSYVCTECMLCVCAQGSRRAKDDYRSNSHHLHLHGLICQNYAREDTRHIRTSEHQKKSKDPRSCQDLIRTRLRNARSLEVPINIQEQNIQVADWRWLSKNSTQCTVFGRADKHTCKETPSRRLKNDSPSTSIPSVHVRPVQLGTPRRERSSHIPANHKYIKEWDLAMGYKYHTVS